MQRPPLVLAPILATLLGASVCATAYAGSDFSATPTSAQGATLSNTLTPVSATLHNDIPVTETDSAEDDLIVTDWIPFADDTYRLSIPAGWHTSHMDTDVLAVQFDPLDTDAPSALVMRHSAAQQTPQTLAANLEKLISDTHGRPLQLLQAHVVEGRGLLRVSDLLDVGHEKQRVAVFVFPDGRGPLVTAAMLTARLDDFERLVC
jgi:hypothetical protein